MFFLFTANNLRRILNDVGKEVLRHFVFDFFLFLTSFLASLELFWRLKKISRKICKNDHLSYNAGIF
jgi:hypothetical protein